MLLLLQSHPYVFPLLAGLVGLLVGSFLNVVIVRLPTMLNRQWRRECEQHLAAAAADDRPFNLVTPRSHCPHCGHRIGALENVPVLSYLWLRGRCSACGVRISPRYPLVELLSAGLSTLVAWHFGFGVAAIAVILLTWALIALTFIDIDHQLLPDVITLPFLWVGLLLNAFSVFADPRSAVIGAAAGYLALWLVFHLFKLVTGKEGMGYGDFKLLALFGAWLGWQSLPLIILLSSFVGAAVGLGFILFRGRDRNLPIPFGPFLCAAGWIALLWGDSMMRYYLRLA
ncbi:MAG TPA: A24 family peptidase [Acidiferrobacterales bacterium]